MEKIEKEYIINIEDTISNFRAELASDARNVRSSTLANRMLSSDSNQDLSLAWRKVELQKILDSLISNKELILDAIVNDYSIAREEAEVYEFYPIYFEVEKLIDKHEKWLVNDVDLAAEELGSGTLDTITNGI